MPKINFDDMPYEKQLSTGERVVSNGFYHPDPDAEESSDIYRGYHAVDLFNIFLDNAVFLSSSGSQ